VSLGKGTCSVTVDADDVAAVAVHPLRPHCEQAREWQPTARARAVLDAVPRLATGRHPADEPPEMRLTRLANRTGTQEWLAATGRLAIGWRPWVVLVVDGEVVLVSVGARSLDDYPIVLGGRQPDARQDWDGRGRSRGAIARPGARIAPRRIAARSSSGQSSDEASRVAPQLHHRPGLPCGCSGSSAISSPPR